MGNIGDKLKEIENKARKTRKRNTILSVFTIVLLAASAILLMLLMQSQEELKTNIADLTNAQKELKAKDSVLSFQNTRLREVQGRLDVFWDDAVKSDNINDYASYLLKAIEGDEHYNEALEKMDALANKTGYVQITDSNGKEYLSPIKELDSDVRFYIANSAMRVRRGVIGDPNFSNTSQIGNKLIQVNDVVRLDEIISTGDAKWAKIGYGN